MHKYIFLTNEWFTQQPNWKEIENIQMVWIWKWNNSKEAFDDFKKENKWILDTSFKKLHCYELKNDSFEFYEL